MREVTSTPASRLGAALLNLSGLGAGCAYLGRWRLAAAHLAGTAALVGGAFLADAASEPWLWWILGGYWLLWLAAGGWWVAASRPLPRGRRRVVPVAGGIVLIAAVVAGLLAYGAAGRQAYDDGVAAQRRGDCATAMDRYDQVTGPFELTLGATVRAAAANRDVCEALVAAHVVSRAGNHEAAVRMLRDLRGQHPDDDVVGAHLTRAYLAWAREHRRARDFGEAITIYRDLLGDRAAHRDEPSVRAELADTYVEQARFLLKAETVDFAPVIDILVVVHEGFADTPAAKLVPPAVAETFAVAGKPVAAGQFCAGVPALDLLAELEPEVIAGIAAPLHANRATALLQCGINRFGSGSYTEAVTSFSSFVAQYPNDPGIPQARSGLIAATVAEASYYPVPFPPPWAGDSPGSVPVTFYNDSNKPTHVLIAGPTAHEFVLPPCGGCPAAYATSAEACPSYDGRPSMTLRLAPGFYPLITKYDEDGGIAGLSDSVSVNPYFESSLCLFVTSNT
jgi:tetratricopeptide (TPR) repeat protein